MLLAWPWESGSARQRGPGPALVGFQLLTWMGREAQAGGGRSHMETERLGGRSGPQGSPRGRPSPALGERLQLAGGGALGLRHTESLAGGSWLLEGTTVNLRAGVGSFWYRQVPTNDGSTYDFSTLWRCESRMHAVETLL